MQTGEDGGFRRANAVFCTWVGYARDELVGHKRLQDLLTVGGRMFHQTHWSPLLRMQGSLSEVKLELVHRDGSKVPMILNAIRRDHDGVVVHDLAAYVARDRDRYERELLSARKRLETVLNETRQLEALATDRALLAEQMMGIVSHDLRNPLSTVNMAAEMLGEVDDKGRARLAQQIKRAITRANHLITDLLDFSQARVAGGLFVAVTETNLHEVVVDALDELRLAHPGHTLAHVRDGKGVASIDANRFAQLIGNLVSNAVAYGTAGQPITVTSRVSSEAVSLAVHNHGEPIATETIATLFDPMVRGTTTKGKAGSVGLGLFIVREIAKAHGGEIAVHSAAGDGTTFTVTVPRA